MGFALIFMASLIAFSTALTSLALGLGIWMSIGAFYLSGFCSLGILIALNTARSRVAEHMETA